MYPLLLLMVVALGPIAAPHEEPTLIAAAFSGEVKLEVVVESQRVHLVKPARPPIVVRLPGPRNLFRCPHCKKTASGCDMFLGEELLKLGAKREYLNKITYRQWGVLYDNIVNSRKPATMVQSSCKGGVCRVFPPRRRPSLFRRLRR